MFVSSVPCRHWSSLIGAASLVVQRRALVRPERLRVDGGGRITRHGGEFLPGNEPPTAPQRDQLADPMAIPGDSEGLSVFDGIHDLPRSCPQIALSNLRISIHKASVALGATW